MEQKIRLTPSLTIVREVSTEMDIATAVAENVLLQKIERAVDSFNGTTKGLTKSKTKYGENTGGFFRWTEEKDKQLKKLSKEGKRPLEVAEIMGLYVDKISHRKNYLKKMKRW